jgi:hypothetical protein
MELFEKFFGEKSREDKKEESEHQKVYDDKFYLTFADI